MIPIIFLTIGLILLFATALHTVGLILTIIGAVMCAFQILVLAISGALIATTIRKTHRRRF